jgi:GNAT superfamily N-acetyltransferase
MDMQGADDRPEATFVALVDGEAVAYAKLALSRARPAAAMHDMTGVRRAWCGCGIARALKAAEIAWAKEERLRAARHGRPDRVKVELVLARGAKRTAERRASQCGG